MRPHLHLALYLKGYNPHLQMHTKSLKSLKDSRIIILVCIADFSLYRVVVMLPCLALCCSRSRGRYTCITLLNFLVFHSSIIFLHIQEKYGRMIELTLFFTKKIHPLSDRFYSIIHFWGIQTQNENPRFLQISFSKNIHFFHLRRKYY